MEKDKKSEELTQEEMAKLQRIEEQNLKAQTEQAEKGWKALLSDILTADVPKMLAKYGTLPSAQLSILLEFKKLQILENIMFALIPKDEKEGK